MVSCTWTIFPRWWMKRTLEKDLAEDGLHPNDAGFRIMALLAEAAIQKTLATR
jgi:lysophospholipase L1-like esterase